MWIFDCGINSGAPTECKTVNDHHSGLNLTIVSNIFKPESVSELQEIVRSAALDGKQIAIAGGRHAMGGQQFLSNQILIDTGNLKRVINFDQEKGLIEVESGIMWPDLIQYLQKSQPDFSMSSSAEAGVVSRCSGGRNFTPWTIRQKQTGCDLLSLGGALSANVHGRGLTKAPIVEDVESFTIVLCDGTVQTCSRHQNYELFSLAIGGYGLFGIISTVTLRLTKLVTLKRSVKVCATKDAVAKLERAKLNGATYGDFQFSIDSQSSDFLQFGILSVYTPVKATLVPPEPAKLLSQSDWEELLYLAHCNKKLAFEKYRDHYLSTNGQLYQSDIFQSATYITDYHRVLDARLKSRCEGSEAITELYVPRAALGKFMKRAAELLRAEQADVIYGTVRLIEPDNETFLKWATQPWACIIFNLHVDHNDHHIDATSKVFRSLYQLAIEFGGKYYLTYNRYAAANQLQSCYPQIAEFIQLKYKYDPQHRFNSDWFNYVENSRNYF